MTRRLVFTVLLFASVASARQLDQNVKRQTDIFEQVLNTAIRGRFEQPFLLLQEPRGAFLDGYGMVFTMEVNLYPMRLRTPFNAAPYSDKELSEGRKQKQARMKDLEVMI